MSYIIKLTPAFKDYLWGGHRLRQELRKDCGMGITAESWELSTHPDGLCRIENGAGAGETLAAWLADHPTALGTRAGRRTDAPVLIKFIDAAQNLSVQVHPDDAYARRVEGDAGKTELWYVLDAAEGAEVICGVSAPLTREELAEKAADGSIVSVLNHVPVKRGDALLVRAGTLHGIGAGVLICEIQAQDVACLTPAEDAARGTTVRLGFLRGGTGYLLAATEYFTAYRFTVSSVLHFAADPASFHAIVVTGGPCTLMYGMQYLDLARGETAFVPAGLGDYTVRGRCEFLLTHI